MEGYLYEKRSESVKSALFSSGKLFKCRWAILQGQVLTLYDDIDLKKQKPKGLVKQRLKVVEMLARTRSQLSDGDRQNCFEILTLEHVEDEQHHDNDVHSDESNTTRVAVYSTDSREETQKWIDAINQACVADELVLNYAQHCSVLGIGISNSSIDDTHEAQITHAYRTLISEHHPDNGGDARVYARITRAYNFLMLSHERKNKNVYFDVIDYMVTVVKSSITVEGTNGLGFEISEDSNGEKRVTSVDKKTINYQRIDSIPGGHIKENDILISIDNDDVILWKYNRVKHRMSDFRQPKSCAVGLRFLRYIKRDTATADTADTAPSQAQLSDIGSDADDDITTTTSFNTLSNANVGKGITFSADVTSDTDPDTSTTEPQRNTTRSILKNMDLGGSSDPHHKPSTARYLGQPTSHSHLPVSNSLIKNKSLPPPIGAVHHGHDFDTSLSPIASIIPSSEGHGHGHDGHAAMVLPLQKENSELKKKMAELEKELAKEQHRYNKANDMATSLAVELKDKNQKLCTLQQQEAYYRIQIEEMLIANINMNETSSSNNKLNEMTSVVNKGVACSSQQLLQGKAIFGSEKSESYLRGLGLALSDVGDKVDTYQHAQRVALCAMSSIDPSAATLRMWDAGGSSAADKLNKLEKRLQKAEQSLGYKQVSTGFQLPGTAVSTSTSSSATDPVIDTGKNIGIGSGGSSPRLKMTTTNNNGSGGLGFASRHLKAP